MVTVFNLSIPRFPLFLFKNDETVSTPVAAAEN